MLSYCGAIFGALATIIAVFLTIRFTREQQQEDRIVAAKPWLTSEINTFNSNQEVLDREDGNTIFVTISDNVYQFSTHVPIEVRRHICSNNVNHCAVAYCITNIGGNTATAIKMKINENQIMQDFAIGKDGKKNFIIFFPIKEHEGISYSIVFEYGDIVSSTIYTQRETFEVVHSEHGCGVVQNGLDELSPPDKKEA